MSLAINDVHALAAVVSTIYALPSLGDRGFCSNICTKFCFEFSQYAPALVWMLLPVPN